MTKYIVIYHAPADAWETTSSTQEEREESVKAWMQWASDCGDRLLDLGAPLMYGIQINPDGTTKTSDKNVMGYSILQTQNLDDAKALLVNHPHLKWDAKCTIEVHEVMPVPGM